MRLVAAQQQQKPYFLRETSHSSFSFCNFYGFPAFFIFFLLFIRFASDRNIAERVYLVSAINLEFFSFCPWVFVRCGIGTQTSTRSVQDLANCASCIMCSERVIHNYRRQRRTEYSSICLAGSTVAVVVHLPCRLETDLVMQNYFEGSNSFGWPKMPQ